MRIERPPTDEELRRLPKVELHVHLEGSISPETLVELARRHGEDLSRLPLVDGRYPYPYPDFGRFVDTYLAISRRIRTAEDLELVAARFVEGLAAQHVRYCEVTVTVTTLIAGGLDPAAMWVALARGLRHPTTEVGIIADAVRNLGVANAEDTIRLVTGADAPVVGLGLAGDERAGPARAFAPLRRAADRLGLGLAVHAGEFGPPSAVTAALDELGADRIGHGVAAAGDPDVLARVVRDRVPLEVCPSSNWRLGVVADLGQHPLPVLWRAGAQVTINSDDPPLFGTSLTEELRWAVRACQLGVSDVAELQRRAIRAAFTDAATRRRVLEEIDAWERSCAHATRGGVEAQEER